MSGGECFRDDAGDCQSGRIDQLFLVARSIAKDALAKFESSWIPLPKESRYDE
jgi:hypothetical protein